MLVFGGQLAGLDRNNVLIAFCRAGLVRKFKLFLVIILSVMRAIIIVKQLIIQYNSVLLRAQLEFLIPIKVVM